jgi:hypothetical protein
VKDLDAGGQVWAFHAHTQPDYRGAQLDFFRVVDERGVDPNAVNSPEVSVRVRTSVGTAWADLWTEHGWTEVIRGSDTDTDAAELAVLACRLVHG